MPDITPESLEGPCPHCGESIHPFDIFRSAKPFGMTLRAIAEMKVFAVSKGWDGEEAKILGMDIGEIKLMQDECKRLKVGPYRKKARVIPLPWRM